jgi:hypothetical protein
MLDELFPPGQGARPRAALARRQRPPAPPGHHAEPVDHRAGGKGEPILGTWQRVFLECDMKPREQAVVVTVRGD